MKKELAVFAETISRLKEKGLDPVVVAMGVFDGVHLGHGKLLQELAVMAQKLSAHPVAVTFFPHPRSVLSPEKAPLLLLPPAEKIRLLKENGAEEVVTLPFTKEFSLLSPEEFLDRFLFGQGVDVRGICVGKNWRFGRGGKGDTSFLEKEAEKRSFLFKAVEELRLKENGRVISSSAIRENIAAGRLAEAEAMLGRPYRLCGTVEEGYHVAGNVLGTPTANLRLEYGVLPPLGVYAARVETGNKTFPAAMNVGVAPTFEKEYGKISPRVELHLLSRPEGPLYGKYVSAEIVSFIRKERKFDSPELLKEQIGKDISEIGKVLAEKIP